MNGEHKFCEEHSEVMRCLGALEEGQKNMAGDVKEIKNAMVSFSDKFTNGRIVLARERVKSSILYWFFAVSGIAIISGIITYLFGKVGMIK